jgi:hypothetical protein
VTIPQRSRLESVHIPAPTGGLNTVAPGYAMPDLDCPLLYNMVGAENGLRSRLGSREWCTTLVGIADNTVRSILPFTGSHKNGSTDKLFACTSKGIYDVSASSAAPTLLVTFGTQTGDAGYGISCVFVNFSGGHFLLLCDEENGYYVYSESTTTWVKVVQASTTAWAASTVYGAGATVVNGGLTYKTTAGGTSAALPATGPSGTSAAIVDNTVTWAYTPSITGVDPATFAHVMVWKNRVWLTARDTALAYWLDVGALFGTATVQNFGPQFKAGGDLRGLYNWTRDGGSGADDGLIAISGGGDVVIYGGTDPSSASSFGLVGKWYCGGVPYGRRIATDHGGELLIMSSLGILPLSKLVLGVVDPEQLYSTYKISNLFSRLSSTYRSLKGWALKLHPEDNSLIVSVPTADGSNTVQLAMSLATRGWSQYRNLPLLSMEAWGGKLYCGTADGRVIQNTDYIDGVTLADPNAFTAIDCSGITKFSNLENANQKQIVTIRATVLSEGGSIAQTVEARYRYNLNEAGAATSTATSAGAALWDSAVWDSSAVWGGAFATDQAPKGAVGMGPDAAVAFRFAATSRTVLVGFDVLFQQGGAL